MYILIRRLALSVDAAEYCFGEDESRLGRLRLNTASGESTQLEVCPDDKTGGIFERAARKLYLHWKANETPESTCWAS